MNMELVNNLRLDAGIARLDDWEGPMVCVNKDGKIIDPIKGLSIFAALVVEECIRVLDEIPFNNSDEAIYACDQIATHFGLNYSPEES